MIQLLHRITGLGRFFAGKSNMNAKVWELEILRRKLETARSQAGSIEEGLERGWGSEEDRAKMQREMQESLALVAELEPQLSALMTQHRHQKSGVNALWVALHLDVCQSLLRAGAENPTDQSGVRAVCLGELIVQLGRILYVEDLTAPKFGFTFSINTCYLPDYEAKFDRVAR